MFVGGSEATLHNFYTVLELHRGYAMMRVGTCREDDVGVVWWTKAGDARLCCTSSIVNISAGMLNPPGDHVHTDKDYVELLDG